MTLLLLAVLSYTFTYVIAAISHSISCPYTSHFYYQLLYLMPWQMSLLLLVVVWHTITDVITTISCFISHLYRSHHALTDLITIISDSLIPSYALTDVIGIISHCSPYHWNSLHMNTIYRSSEWYLLTFVAITGHQIELLQIKLLCKGISIITIVMWA